MFGFDLCGFTTIHMFYLMVAVLCVWQPFTFHYVCYFISFTLVCSISVMFYYHHALSKSHWFRTQILNIETQNSSFSTGGIVVFESDNFLSFPTGSYKDLKMTRKCTLGKSQGFQQFLEIILKGFIKIPS